MCMSCQLEEDQMGYPRTVTFPKEGGEIIVKGQTYSGELYIGRHWDLGIGIQMLFLMRKTVMKQSGING